MNKRQRFVYAIGMYVIMRWLSQLWTAFTRVALREAAIRKDEAAKKKLREEWLTKVHGQKVSNN